MPGFLGDRFLLGVNYWSQGGGPAMWDGARFDLPRIERELRLMRDLGCNVFRSFLFVPAFMPEPPRINADAVARFGLFLRACEAHGLRTMPSLLVGHMSGQNFDFAGRRGRSLYADPEILRWQEALCAAAAGAAAGSPALAAWVLSNEMPLWAGASDPVTVRLWADRLVGTLRRLTPGIPVGTGDGLMSLKGGQNGFDPALLADLLDFLGPHSYYTDRDALRHGLRADFLVRLLEHHGKPVLLEEFGASSAQAGDLQLAAYWRETIHAVYTLGGAGALGWCFGDLELPADVPYDHHPIELGFGIVRADGTPKAAALELRAAAAALGRPGPPPAPPAARAALVVPSFFWRDYPFSWEDRTRMHRTLLQAYAMAALAGLDPAVVPEDAVAAHGPVALWIVPSTQKLLAGTWEELERRARDGATVYVSYYGSDFDFHQGQWWHRFEPCAGARIELRYGLPDHPGPSLVLQAGRRVLLRCPVPPPEAVEPFRTSFLPLQPITARVLLRDAAGRPALLRNELGRGRFLFGAFPVEYLLTLPLEANASGATGALYRLLAREAGLPDSRLPPGVMERVIGESRWLLNRTWRPQRVGLQAASRSRRPRGRALTIALPPKGVVSLPAG